VANAAMGPLRRPSAPPIIIISQSPIQRDETAAADRPWYAQSLTHRGPARYPFVGCSERLWGCKMTYHLNPTCERCGREVPQSSLQDGCCERCRTTADGKYTCRCCGATIDLLLPPAFGLCRACLDALHTTPKISREPEKQGTEPELPAPRADGKCVECGQKPAVTRDGRYCKKCLQKIIAHLTPMIGCYAGRNRGPDHRQDRGEGPSPSQETAIRQLEDG